MRKNILLAILLSGALGLFAQETQMARAGLLTRFKFEQVTGGIVVVRATLNNFNDTLNFILDTGSGGISLDTATTLRLKLPLEPSDRTVRGIGGIRKLSFYKQGTLHFPGLIVSNLDFHVNDYEILSEVYGIRVDGIIGYSFLRRYIVALNYDAQEITVYSPGSYQYPRGGFFLNPQFLSIPLNAHEITDRTTFNSNLYFDSGAGLCVMLSEQFMKDSAFAKPNRQVVTTQVEGMVGKITMQLSVMKKMKLGKYTFRNVPIHIYNDSVNVFGYPGVVGLLGSDLLRRFNIVLNYPERRIHLVPNSHFSDPFDYSYTGMSFYFIDGKVVITEVQQGSPADEAGFQPGDVIFGVENNFSNNIQQYKSIIQNQGEKLRLIIFRDGKPMMLMLKVASIR
ncbi:MAG: aspartyl protease family protein [Chitinophagaceae bacterium]